ncbi:MAG: fibronectin type III-like domain-contianing protein, partial [Clostridiales bacterium]|nr:fibronectin type III-like domain-contianing protein [Clostridiales bacterium]
VPADGEVTISCTVKNTGTRSGDEVVQFYTRFTDANVTRPIKQIVGFKRLTLEPGEEKRVSCRLKMSQMGYYNENMEFVVEPGTMKVMVGDAENALPLKGEFTITGPAVNVMGKRSYTSEITVE